MCLKQHIPPKKQPWGLKVWVRVGTSGYMYRFEVYQGLAGRGQVSPLGMAADVVMRLCDDIRQRNRKVFFDNFFPTIPLIQALQQQGIYGTGTCRINRLQGAQLKLKSEKQVKNKGGGASSVVSRAENITVTRWLDSSVIHMASSCVGQSPPDVAQRWTKKEKKDAQHPKAIFYEAVQSAYRRSRSHGSMCCNVSPQTQKQTVVDPSLLSILGRDHGECLAALQNVWIGKEGSSAFQAICSTCANKCRFHPDTQKRKTQCHPTSFEAQSSVQGTPCDQVWPWKPLAPA